MTIKMEEASFIFFRQANLLFQYRNQSTYFVHHLSAYEHSIRKKYGYDASEKAAYDMAQQIFWKECHAIPLDSLKNPHISLIPFYGGRPPQVTPDLRVESIGQGNSLVNATTKALQCIASACSCLRYIGGRVAIGVTSIRDRDILLQTVTPPHTPSPTLIYTLSPSIFC
jgi:hypothetical protein